jgi:tetratricopeptide (TPR) repeat protein
MCLVYSCADKSHKPLSNLDQANLEELNQWITLYPNNDSLYYHRAKYYIEAEQFDSAIHDLKLALSIDSTKKPDYYHVLSDVYLLNLNSKIALNVIELALERFPNDKKTILKSAKLKLILKQHLGALATLDKIFMRDPQYAPAHYLAGHIFYDMKEIGRAVNSYQKAVDLDPEMREAWIRLGDVLTELLNPKAILYYDNAIRMDSTDITTMHSRAYALHSLSKLQESLSSYLEISRRFPDYEPAFYNAGIIYKELDSIPKAIEFLNQSIALDSTIYSSYYQRGLCYKIAGENQKAKKDFEKAIELNSSFGDAQKALQRISN